MNRPSERVTNRRRFGEEQADLRAFLAEELAYLRGRTGELADRRTELAAALAPEQEDPDVQLLLKGFAFLSARIRQRLDDEYPEITHAYLSVLWPHVLRPVPSLTTLQFKPRPNTLRVGQTVPEGAVVLSRPVNETPFPFRTTAAIEVLPLTLAEVRMEGPATTRPLLRLRFRFHAGCTTASVPLRALRLHFPRRDSNACELMRFMTSGLREVRVRIRESGRDESEAIPARSVVPIDVTGEPPLWPYPPHVQPGYRLLQEFFAFPERFLYVDVTGLDGLRRLRPAAEFDLEFHLGGTPDLPREIDESDVLLHCVPAVNLQAFSTRVQVDHRREEYEVRLPEEDLPGGEIFSVDQVRQVDERAARETVLAPVYSFRRLGRDEQRGHRYDVRRRGFGSFREGARTCLSLAYHESDPPRQPWLLLADVQATSGAQAGGREVGDISMPHTHAPDPATIQVRNISRSTAYIPAPGDATYHWRLISHMALGRSTLSDVDNLRAVLSLYNIRGLIDRPEGRAVEKLIHAIQSVRTEPRTRFYQGVPIRGLGIHFDIDGAEFAVPGRLHEFVSVLQHFVRMFASINSFTQVSARDVRTQEVLEWPARVGSKILL